MTTNEIPQLPPEHFVPESTRSNYLQMARDRAGISGKSPKTELAAMAKQWLTQHEDDPRSGYDHLAAWAKGVDPGDGTDSLDPAAAAKSRAIESARRDPVPALAGDPDVAAAAAEALAAPATGTRPADTGGVPNPGDAPIKIPTESASSSS